MRIVVKDRKENKVVDTNSLYVAVNTFFTWNYRLKNDIDNKKRLLNDLQENKAVKMFDVSIAIYD